ncbi:Exodeoxyribonuclease 7 small subunit [subsurface metagenome]
MKFEEAMERLEKITEELEQGNLSLDGALAKFEEGMKLISFCEKRLDEVKKKIQVLIKEGEKFRLKDWAKERITGEREKSRKTESLKKPPSSDSLFRNEEN